MDLEQYRIQSDLEAAYYIPEFITEAEEEYILRKINESSAVKWKNLPNRRLQIWGGEVTSSNVLIPAPIPNFVTEYPDLIGRLRNTGVFSGSKHGQPNHIIVNEYRPGQGIMPHEDGPSYHPVVATLSLGGHAVFHYHQYIREQESNAATGGHGKSINPTPLLSVLLERRSLVITTKDLYTGHLHSISHITRDIFSHESAGDGDINEVMMARKLANHKLLRDPKIKIAVEDGGVLERVTRVSLTCRDVEKVVGGKSGFLFGKR